MTDQSEIAKMRSEATQELNSMKFKESNVTRNVNKCLKLVEVFKGEKTQVNSPLLKQSAEDVMTHYNRAKVSLEDLEESMEKCLRLSWLTHDGPEIDLQELIDDSLAAIEVYSTTFENIKGLNTEIF